MVRYDEYYVCAYIPILRFIYFPFRILALYDWRLSFYAACNPMYPMYRDRLVSFDLSNATDRDEPYPRH